MRDRRRSRSREKRQSPSGEERRKRSRSRDRGRDDERRRSRSRERGDTGGGGAKKAARLAKLQAWKAQQQSGQQGGAASATTGHAHREPSPQQAAAAFAAGPSHAAPLTLPPEQFPQQLQPPQSPQPQPQPPHLPSFRREAQGPQEEAAELEPEGDEVDPLDAFMAAEVLPEVRAREQEERRVAAEERKALAELLAKGKVPKALEELIREEEEEVPDMTIELPANKIKLVIGAGGEKVKLIQRKTKCRVQHAKADDELVRGFGAAAAAPAPAPAGGAAAEPRMVKLQLFGNAAACEAARAMIMEAVDNRDQKAKQRAREYEKKKEAKRLERQIYHMRHARDYEALGLPLGASKAEAKAAFRKLALRWHPDKNPDNREEAEARFQEISRAYESLMTTDEDARVEQLAGK